MLDWILKIFTWIGSFWSSLSEDTKKKIIEAIVELFDDIFRKYYQSQQQVKKGEANVNP